MVSLLESTETFPRRAPADRSSGITVQKQGRPVRSGEIDKCGWLRVVHLPQLRGRWGLCSSREGPGWLVGHSQRCPLYTGSVCPGKVHPGLNCVIRGRLFDISVLEFHHLENNVCLVLVSLITAVSLNTCLPVKISQRVLMSSVRTLRTISSVLGEVVFWPRDVVLLKFYLARFRGLKERHVRGVAGGWTGLESQRPAPGSWASLLTPVRKPSLRFCLPCPPSSPWCMACSWLKSWERGASGDLARPTAFSPGAPLLGTD